MIQLVNDCQAVIQKGGDSQKVVELTNWMIAGHDSTGYSLSNALILLAKHPQVQEKLRQETKGVDNPHLTDYFQWVIKEANRLVPVAALGSIRVTGRNYTTQDGCIIPKGAICFLAQHHGNRNPAVCEEPDLFRPERWENPTQAMLQQHMPFSLGNRDCPGQAVAMAEINSALPLPLSKRSFELEDEGELDFFLALKCIGARLRAVKI